MSAQLFTQEIRDFGPLATSIESTDQGNRLYRALNCILRPKNAIKGKLRYLRLWGIGSSQSVETTFRALTFTGFPSGVGNNSTNRNLNKTIAIRIYKQGKNFLLFYDLVNSKARGLYYMGDDGTYTSGSYDFSAATPTFEVLAVGLNSSARWYGKRQATMLKISNNVDDPVCVQLARTAAPGKWRKAGSNVAPATPVISLVATASSTNAQATFTISPAEEVKFIADPTTEKLWSYVSGATCTAVVATDRLTIAAGYKPANGDKVMLAGTTAPTGTSLFTLYYVVSAAGQTCALAATPGGTRINLTTTGTGLSIVLLKAHLLADGDQVILNSAGTIPTGLAEQQYFVRDSATNSFSLADTSGGAVVAFTTQGVTPLQQTFTKTTTSQRIGGKALTFTADTKNFPGAEGNSKIQVSITFTSYATNISSARTGSGSIADPFIYKLTTGPAADASSNDAIVAFVNADTLARGILTASTALPDATADSGTWAATFLANGTGTGTSEGFTNQTCSVYLRYFDAGNERIGYEGVSSAQSNILVLDENTRSDILVTITPDPNAEGGRFGFIRVYFQFGEAAEAIWSLMGEVANTSGTKTLQIGSNTVIGQALNVDQNRPLPFKATVMVKNQIWHGGNPNTPDFLYVSKAAVDDEIAPEGANAGFPYRIAIPEQTSPTRVTALETDNFRLHVHTSQGLIILDPENPDADRHIPQVPVGAINPAAIAQWEKSGTFYLGTNLEVYEFDGARYGKRNVSAATKDAQNYVLSKASIEAITRQPDRVNAWLDARSQLLWYFFPAAADDKLIGFAYDFESRGITGEFVAPKIYATAEMEPERTETIFCDEEGNLFFLDSRTQYDWTDDLGSWPVFTGYSVGTAPPVQFNGYPYFDYEGVRYYQASEDIFETGFIDLGAGTARKNFQGLQFRTVKGSRAFVEVTFTNKDGRSVTRKYGDIGAKGHDQVHKVLAMLSGDAIKIKMRIISAEQAPWIIRSMALLYRSAGQL